VTDVAIRRLFRVVNGGTPTAYEANWNGDVLWATPIDLAAVDGASVTSTARTLTRVGVDSGSATVPAGSLVLSTRAPIGYVAATTTETAFNQGCRGLVPRVPLDLRFFRYLLLARRADLVSRGQGSTFTELSSDSLATFKIRRPPLAEQREIADFLDAETARIDALIEKKRRLIALLDERSFALLSKVLIPHGCRLTRLGRLAEIQTGLTVDGSRPTGDDVVTRPYLRVANVLHGRLALDTVTEIAVPRTLAERATLRAGDVLMTEGGDLDKLGRGTVWRDEIPGCLHQNHVFAVRSDPGRLDAEYLALLTQTAHGRAYFERTGSRVTNLASTSSTKVLDFPVPVLPPEQQRALLREASTATATLAEISSCLTKQIDLLREHRQAVITAAVTGQLDTARSASTA
jgi:type I restriction enzyme S subunit